MASADQRGSWDEVHRGSLWRWQVGLCTWSSHWLGASGANGVLGWCVTTRATLFFATCRRLRCKPGNPNSKLLLQSSRNTTKNWTIVAHDSFVRCLRMFPIWRRWQYIDLQMVLICGIMLICWSKIAPRSLTASAGSIVALPRVIVGLRAWMADVCRFGTTTSNSKTTCRRY